MTCCDRAAAIDQHADLAVELARSAAASCARELARHDLGRRDAPAIQPLQRLDLARLEARRGFR